MTVNIESSEYFRIGEAALALCKRHLGNRTPKRIIDFPSGHGRATRWFRAEWPNAEIVAVETDMDALSFVSKTFGVLPIISHPRLEMVIPDQADLIFSGSLLTHFDEWQWDRFIDLTVGALAPDGVLVFTIHGRIYALLAKNNNAIFGNLISGHELYETYKKEGFAYQPYSEESPEYGISLSSPSWVMRKLEQIPDARIVSFEEQGWGQDVVVLKRNPWPIIED